MADQFLALKMEVRLVMVLLYSISVVQAQAQARLYPALFAFGDSLVDSGNNNYITLSLAKADLFPNGIDFPTRTATGRFCNGRTSFDVLCDLIGLPYPPPALAPTSRGPAILRGLNYASGAAGILNETGADYIERLTFNQQISLFQRSVVELNLMLGRSAATYLLHGSLFAVAMGGNDYINNYLLTTDNTSRTMYTPSQFLQLLMSTYRAQLTISCMYLPTREKMHHRFWLDHYDINQNVRLYLDEWIPNTLYYSGARKFVILNIGPLGCTPSRLALASSDGTCVSYDNEMAKGFNGQLRPLLRELTETLQGSMFLYGNSYDVVNNLIQDPFPSGFNVVNEGCCGAGTFNGQLPCLPVIDSLCSNRSEYVFWDPYHPTEAVNVLLGTRAFNGSLSAISPMNVQELSAVIL